MVKIFIDAGHGGRDGGAVGNGILEKDINLKIAKEMQSQLKNYNNVSVKMSRTGDSTLSLSQRTSMANSWGADALISVHINSSTSSSARGFESYVYPSVNERTASLQADIHNEVWKQIDKYSNDNRGKKRANFHMLRESAMKAVLTENLFISSSADAKLLKSSSFIKALATGHVNGIAKHFGLKKTVAPKPTPSRPSTGKMWLVQIGAFSKKTNAEKLVDKVKKDGYNAFLKYDDSLFKVQVGAFKDESNAIDLKKRLEKDGYNVFIDEE